MDNPLQPITHKGFITGNDLHLPKSNIASEARRNPVPVRTEMTDMQFDGSGPALSVLVGADGHALG